MLGMAAAGLCFCECMVRPHTDDGTTKGKHGEAMPSQINVLPLPHVSN